MNDPIDVDDSSSTSTSSGLPSSLYSRARTRSSSADFADVESDSSITGASASEQEKTLTLLDCLKPPQQSPLARKRKISTNPPPTGFKKSKGVSCYDPKSVRPTDRVREYPEEPLKVSNGKLFCTGCREELSLKKSSIDLHIRSSKHSKNKEKLKLKEQRELDIAEALKSYQARVHLKGETLPENTRVFRVKVMRAMLQAGIPIEKVDGLRDLLEETGYSLCDSSHLRELIPFMLEEEISKLKKEICGKHLSIIFDGTTHVCEALVVIIRYMDGWTIKQQVCRLMLLAKALTGEELARQLVTVISTELSVQPSLIVAGMRDRASVNSLAMRTISVIYNKVMDIGCFSHAIDHVGERMQTPLLDEFMSNWISLFSRSPKAKLIWKSQTGISILSFSNTRWWSRFELIKQVRDMFGDVVLFLKNEDLTTVTAQRLRTIMDDMPSLRKLKMEIAIMVDAMEPFVKVTYDLEGDGPLVLFAYQKISTLYAHISLAHHPNVVSVAKDLAQGNTTHEAQLKQYANTCYPPAYSYFKEKFGNDLKDSVEAFKAARYFLPCKINELKPSISDIQFLQLFPFIDSTLISELKLEMAEYVAAAEDVVESVNPLNWWKAKEENHSLLSWVKALKLVLLVQPSSAAAERVFSILSSSFNSRQESSLEDYIQFSVMMQYNSRL